MRGDKGNGNGKNKFITARSDNSDVEEGSEDMSISQKLSTSLATAALKQNIKRSMFGELFYDVIASSPLHSRYRPQPFDATDENPFLDAIPAPSADNSKGMQSLHRQNPNCRHPIHQYEQHASALRSSSPRTRTTSRLPLILEATKKGTFLIHMLGLFSFHSCQRT